MCLIKNVRANTLAFICLCFDTFYSSWSHISRNFFSLFLPGDSTSKSVPITAIFWDSKCTRGWNKACHDGDPKVETCERMPFSIQAFLSWPWNLASSWFCSMHAGLYVCLCLWFDPQLSGGEQISGTMQLCTSSTGKTSYGDRHSLLDIWTLPQSVTGVYVHKHE